MEKYTITRRDLDENNLYIGKTDLSDFKGHIEAEAGLGLITYDKPLMAEGDIVFHEGSGIVAKSTVCAKGNITAKAVITDHNIYAGRDIKAGCLYAKYGIEAGGDIIVPTNSAITAGWGIRAGRNIAGGYIGAGFDILAAGRINAVHFVRSMSGDIVGAASVKSWHDIEAKKGNVLSIGNIGGESIKCRFMAATRAFGRHIEGMIEIGSNVMRVDEVNAALGRLDRMKDAQAAFTAPPAPRPKR